MPRNLHSVVRSVSEGDSGAFREIFETFSPKVYAFALKLTHSQATAEELVQEVFLRIWLNRKTLGDVEHFPAYLYTITRNLAFNVLKRFSIEEKAKAEFARHLPLENPETEESVIYTDYQRILNSAIARLSPQQRMVYSLCHVEGLKYEEAAARLHISRLTVKTHMQQALRNIKTHVSRIVAIYAILAIVIF